MKRHLRIAILLFTFLLYQLEAINIVAHSQINTPGSHNKGEDEQILASIISGSLFCLPAKMGDPNGEKTVSGADASQFSGFVSRVNSISQNRHLENFIAKYISDSYNSVIHFRKQDMIFPFQYFW